MKMSVKKRRERERVSEKNEAGDDEARALNVDARMYVCMYFARDIWI